MFSYKPIYLHAHQLAYNARLPKHRFNYNAYLPTHALAWTHIPTCMYTLQGATTYICIASIYTCNMYLQDIPIYKLLCFHANLLVPTPILVTHTCTYLPPEIQTYNTLLPTNTRIYMPTCSHVPTCMHTYDTTRICLQQTSTRHIPTKQTHLLTNTSAYIVYTYRY